MLAALGLIMRMVYLSIVNRPFLQKQSDARSLRVVDIPAYRGMITDRNGEPLAISTPVDSVWINPQIFEANFQQCKMLTKLLGISMAALQKLSNKKSNREFVYLKRRIPPPLADKIKTLNIPNVFFLREYKRYYPESEVAAHVVGFTNVDDKGQEGLELAYNNWLQGVLGKRRVIKDLYGHIVADVGVIQKPEQGQNLTLSIDRRIQYLAYSELAAAVEQYKAQSGSIVVLDTKSGEVLAMANQPSYNPNNPLGQSFSNYRNRAVTDVFEPGSTLKVFSIASALDSGKYTPDTKIDTNPGWISINGNIVRDEDLNYGVIDVTQVLQKSSNVGVAKMTISLPPKQLWDLLNRVGFGERTQSGFPGEATGSLVNYSHWRPFALATLAFGYGISVTTLQLAQAYSIIAAGGISYPITFLKRDYPPEGQRKMDAHVAAEMLTMLESVIQTGGTGRLAGIPGYRVAGKTGTAYIAGPNGYDKHKHVASFVGIAPASDPRLVVAVVIYNPQEQHFGGLVAAPVFSHVMEGALRTLNIAPDNLKTVAGGNGNVPH